MKATVDPGQNGQDQSLVAAIAHGDRGALETVYRKLKDDLASAAYHLLGDRAAAEDVLQDVFVGLARSAGKIRLTHGIRGYLLVSCMNRARDLLRRRKIEPTHVDFLDDRRGRTERPDQVAARLEDAAQVAAALSKLPEEQREVVVLRVYGRLKFREIAEITGVSINTVQSRHRYALDALRRDLVPMEPGDERRTRSG